MLSTSSRARYRCHLLHSPRVHGAVFPKRAPLSLFRTSPQSLDVHHPLCPLTVFLRLSSLRTTTETYVVDELDATGRTARQASRRNARLHTCFDLLPFHRELTPPLQIHIRNPESPCHGRLLSLCDRRASRSLHCAHCTVLLLFYEQQ
jgi:hypothetical protein